MGECKYNYLSYIGGDTRNRHGRYANYKCRLCGTIKNMMKSHVEKHKVISCGCIHSLRPRKDLTGQTINGVLFIGYVGKAKWRVKFSCGHIQDIAANQVKNRRYSSCRDCTRDVTLRKTRRKHGNTVGGYSDTYNSWISMRRRCYDKNNNRYSLYGGSGVYVCDRWIGEDGFSNFLEDMGERPKGRYSIERVDRGRPYEPSNCVWADDITQANNKANVKLITNGEESMSLKYWCRKLGRDYKRCWYLIVRKDIEVSDVLGEGFKYVK